jgi:alpha-mannosidase
MISLDDGCAEMAIITDVSMGGASLNDGQLELMVHRRIQDDDSRGVQEPLNETMCGCNDIGAAPGNMGAHGREGDGGCECAGLTIRGRHWVILDTVEKVNELRRKGIEKLSFPATLAFSSSKLSPKNPNFTALGSELPENIKLMTLTDNYQNINNGASLLRLSHMYSVGEHPSLSLPTTVNLANVFSKPGFNIDTITETSLTGNQAPITDKFKWKTKVLNQGVQDQLDEFTSYDERNEYNAETTEVTLRPMELRTFFVTWKRSVENKSKQMKKIRGLH